MLTRTQASRPRLGLRTPVLSLDQGKDNVTDNCMLYCTRMWALEKVTSIFASAGRLTYLCGQCWLNPITWYNTTMPADTPCSHLYRTFTYTYIRFCYTGSGLLVYYLGGWVLLASLQTQWRRLTHQRTQSMSVTQHPLPTLAL